MSYILHTDRLTLRPLDISDLTTVHTYASNDENTRYMQWLPNRTIAQTEAFLRRIAAEWQKNQPSFYEFAIVKDGVQIGAVSLALDDARQVGELGWILDKRYWRQGIALEAAQAVKSFALDTLGLGKLSANCDARNEGSYRLMQKLGLTLESDSGTRTYPQTGETAKELVCSLTIAK